MSLAPQTLVEAFEKGEALVGLSQDDLTPAEDILIQHFLPPNKGLGSEEQIAVCAINWQARSRLLDTLRGTRFFGNLIDISLNPLADAADKLRASGAYGRRLQHDTEALRNNVIGFVVAATIESSNPKMYGTVKRPVWLLRRPRSSVRTLDILWERCVGEDEGNNTLNSVAASLAKRATRHMLLDP